MATPVSGDLYFDIDGQLLEITRQLRQKGGYPYDPMQLVEHLQAAIEGNFVDHNGEPLLRPQLLEHIGIVTIPAISEHFIVFDRFVLNFGPGVKPGVRICYLGDDLKEWFGGKIEKPVASTELRYAKLLRTERDDPIMKELGEAKETTLAQVHALMKLQPNGQEGALLTSGWANIFYVCDIQGELRAVRVSWDGVGWSVSAYSVTFPSRWGDENRVFSRNS